MKRSRLRIVEGLKSLFECSDYTKNFLFESDVKSNIFIGITVVVLELYMLMRVVFKNISSETPQDFNWVMKHTYSYLILMTLAGCSVVYSIMYKNGVTKNKTLGIFIKLLFCTISIAFGIYISYMSSNAASQVFAFLSMEIFVLCIYVWTPVQGLFISTVSFLVYLYFQSKLGPIYYGTKVNSFTAWLMLLICSLNTFYQERSEATKEERLERLTKYLGEKSTRDELTGLPNLHKFQRDSIEFLQNANIDFSKWRFVFTDITNFRNYNEKYGFTAGNNFLRTFGQFFAEEFSGEIFARFSDDHFVVLAKIDGLEEKLDHLNDRLQKSEVDVQMTLKAGLYKPNDQFTSPVKACDHARYACETISKNYTKKYAEYNDFMRKEFDRKRYIVNNLDAAIQNGYIKVFYQPVVWADDGTLCGAEALARWDDPDFGFLPPGIFISILEEYHLIHKLDMTVMEIVCRDLKDAKDHKRKTFPVSINFSRLDFELSDPVVELETCLKKYGIGKKDIHVEITESTLGDENERLTSALNNFREKGYSLWLDDFGSGYSGLNVLKDYSFDTMKIDMKFLSKFSENQKTQPILTSVVELAKKIGMDTLSEGVETQEAYDFLKSIGCQRLQGYLFGKPMPRSEFAEKIKNGTYVISERIE